MAAMHIALLFLTVAGAAHRSGGALRSSTNATVLQIPAVKAMAGRKQQRRTYFLRLNRARARDRRTAAKQGLTHAGPDLWQ